MSLKRIAVALAVGVTLVLAGTVTFETISRQQAPTPAATTTSAPVAAGSTPTAPAQPTAARPSAVSNEEAQQAVRAFFAALDAADFQSARKLTSGQARETTDLLIGRVESEARARGVDLVIQTRRLDMAAPATVGSRASVDADFSTEVSGKVGPVVIPGQTIAGRATFTVERVDGQIKIVQMSGVGL